MRRRGQATVAVALFLAALLVGQWGAFARAGRTAAASPVASSTTTATSTTSTVPGSTTTTSSTAVTTTTVPSTTTTIPPEPVGNEGPALAADFPDPTILVQNGTYYAYATEVGFVQIQESESVDLVHWTPIGDALPTVPSWANPFHTWAPSVIKTSSAYLMYYTVQDAASGRQCISMATATQPAGPFTDDSSAPFICQLSLGGSIDPAVFVDGDGDLYLTWKNDGNAIGQPTDVWAQQLSPDGLGFLGAPAELLTADQPWEGGIIEAPGMILAGGTYYLFYTGGAWDTAGAAIGYATCASALGPCTKVTTTGPWLASQGVMAGPGSPAFFTGADGQLRMAFDAWNPARVGYAGGGERSLWIADVAITSSGPVSSADQPPSPVASYLTVQAPESVDPGQPFDVAVTVRNLDGVAAGYAGSVQLSSTDPQANLPPDYTFTAADAGVHVFSGVSFATAGPQQITATDTATPAITGQTEVAVAGVSVTAGGTVSDGSVPSSSQPLVVGVTSPQAGAVLIVTAQSVTLASPGYRPVAQVARVLAPPATPSTPLTLTFELAASALGGPASTGDIVVYQDGELVVGCASSGAVPDPCLAGESIAFGFAQLTVLASSGGTWSFGVQEVVRVAGADRTATAIAVSEASYPQPGSASGAVLARSDEFPDALAGTPLAANVHGPLLVTAPDSLDPRVAAELTRAVAPGSTVYVLGGPAALSDGVSSAVTALGFTVRRLGGADRFATAAVIAQAGLGAPAVVFEATGLDFADALAAGTAAAAVHGAVLLTDGPALPAATSQYLAQYAPAIQYAVGGPAASADPGATAIAGADRYATAALIADRFFPNPSSVGIASGANWPDALSGGARQGTTGGALLLSDPDTLSPDAAAYLSAHAGSIATVEVYGGDDAISDGVEDGVQAAVT